MIRVIWEWIRNGLSAAQTVAELRREHVALRQEWSDVLDKLLAREDRERKRAKRVIAEQLEPPQQRTEAPLDYKAHLRHRMGA